MRAKKISLPLLIRISNYVFFLCMLASLGVAIYFLSLVPYENSEYKANKSISKTIGWIGTGISFVPFLGLVIKYSLKAVENTKHKDALVVRVLKDFLTWERKTRLLLAWTAIFCLMSHMTIFASYIDTMHFTWDSKFKWNTPTIIGATSMALLILMNLNGIGILVLRRLKKHLDKIKYIGMFNLVCGITYFVLTLVHIITVG